MNTGAITQNIDIAQVVLYLFWIFFAGLIWYLRREDKREGYPLESDRSPNVPVVGFPAMPPPKVFRLRQGTTYTAPPGNPDRREIKATPVAPWPGAPLEPTGNPMLDGVGPAAYGDRKDIVDVTAEGEPKIVPLRVATDYYVAHQDPDPRGMTVVGADDVAAGTVSDIWVDRSEPQIRYLEVDVAGASRRVLLPITLSRIDAGRRRVRVESILAMHFASVPGTRNADQVTFLEEDKITAYYAGGHLYAQVSRLGPVL